MCGRSLRESHRADTSFDASANVLFLGTLSPIIGRPAGPVLTRKKKREARRHRESPSHGCHYLVSDVSLCSGSSNGLIASRATAARRARKRHNGGLNLRALWRMLLIPAAPCRYWLYRIRACVGVRPSWPDATGRRIVICRLHGTSYDSTLFGHAGLADRSRRSGDVVCTRYCVRPA